MMRNLILAFAIGAIASFAICRMLGDHLPESYVSCVVMNKSGHVVNTLELRHGKGNVKVNNIVNGKSVELLFYAGGEDSYEITATFDENSVISSGGEYVESGYRTEETIYRDTIITER